MPLLREEGWLRIKKYAKLPLKSADGVVTKDAFGDTFLMARPPLLFQEGHTTSQNVKLNNPAN
jgi:hypothetical protein